MYISHLYESFILCKLCELCKLYEYFMNHLKSREITLNHLKYFKIFLFLKDLTFFVNI